MFTSTYLLLIALAAEPSLAVAPEDPDALDRIAVNTNRASMDLSWADSEDRLKGALSPFPLRADVPMQVSVSVGTYSGPDFDGPLTITLKAPGAQKGESIEVKRPPGERLWLARFTPHEEGPHTLEFSFRTTRLKRTVATIDVADAPVPRWPWYALLAVVTALAIGFGARSALKDR
jgi:hypothetical protein